MLRRCSTIAAFYYVWLLVTRYVTLRFGSGRGCLLLVVWCVCVDLRFSVTIPPVPVVPVCCRFAADVTLRLRCTLPRLLRLPLPTTHTFCGSVVTHGYGYYTFARLLHAADVVTLRLVCCVYGCLLLLLPVGCAVRYRLLRSLPHVTVVTHLLYTRCLRVVVPVGYRVAPDAFPRCSAVLPFVTVTRYAHRLFAFDLVTALLLPLDCWLLRLRCTAFCYPFVR